MKLPIICHFLVLVSLNVNPLSKKYIFTGPPGSGKTTLILGLEMYHDFTVIREAAADIIAVELSQNIVAPWQDSTFDDKILALQQKRLHHITTTNTPILCDRSPIDIYAYAAFHKLPIPVHLNKKVSQLLTDPTMSKTVFFIENLGSIQRTAIRAETFDDAQHIEKLLYNYYTFFGFTVIRVPALPLHERIDFVTKKINELKESY